MRNIFKITLIVTAVFFAACNNPSATDNATAISDSGSHEESPESKDVTSNSKRDVIVLVNFDEFHSL